MVESVKKCLVAKLVVLFHLAGYPFPRGAPASSTASPAQSICSFASKNRLRSPISLPLEDLFPIGNIS